MSTSKVGDCPKQDEALINQMTWKPSQCRNVAIHIIQATMRLFENEEGVFPDEIDFSFLSDDDKNLVGTAYKNLARQGIIIQTGNFRRSHPKDVSGNKSRNRRVIFGYRIANVSLANLFLKRNGFVPTSPQMEFAV
jgi:hypothetical protein